MPPIENHYINRNNWLRAGVLGANDGILSTTSLIIGIAAANTSQEAILIAAIASIVAGAGSMAAGEYVSVSSQMDVEKADLKREKQELENMPEIELQELAGIYVKRGLSKDLAMQVAKELTAHNALEAHAKDELGINDMTKPKPIQAAFASALAFVSGGILPLIVSIFAPINYMIYWQYGFAIIFLALSGAIAAKLGGSAIKISVLRICLWGTLAMAVSAIIGHFFGVAIA